MLPGIKCAEGVTRTMAVFQIPNAGLPYGLIEPQGETSPNALDSEWISELYRQHGALLLRGFDTNIDSFRRFAAQFCTTSVFNESTDRQILDATQNIQSVNGGVRPFPLHPELSREPWKPDVCFFTALSPPHAQGATTICDGVELARRMPAAIREGLVNRRLLYIQQAAPEILDYWLGTPRPSDAQLAAPPDACPYQFRRMGNIVIRTFSRPALHKPMFTDGPAFGNFLLFARYHNGRHNFPVLDDGQPVPETWVEAIKALGDTLSTPVQWQKGDLLMLDNSRFMHGRTAILDPHERLIASYFGYLTFAVPDPEEPVDAIWRRENFRPPVPSAARMATRIA